MFLLDKNMYKWRAGLFLELTEHRVYLVYMRSSPISRAVVASVVPGAGVLRDNRPVRGQRHMHGEARDSEEALPSKDKIYKIR